MAHRKKWVVPRFSREEIESKSPLFLASEGWSSRGTNAEKKCAARSGRLFRVFPLFTSVRSVEWQSLRNRRRQNRIGHLRCVRKDHLPEHRPYPRSEDRRLRTLPRTLAASIAFYHSRGGARLPDHRAERHSSASRRTARN